MSEQDITREVIRAINATGCAFVWRNQSGKVQVRRGWMHLAPEGSPDIVGFTTPGGRCIGLETKRPKDSRIADAQEDVRERLAKAGGICGYVRSVDEAVRLVMGAVRVAS